MILFKIVGVIFLLFVICFIAIIIEETCFGGRRRRKLERLAREKRAAIPAESAHGPDHGTGSARSS